MTKTYDDYQAGDRVWVSTMYSPEPEAYPGTVEVLHLGRLYVSYDEPSGHYTTPLDSMLDFVHATEDEALAAWHTPLRAQVRKMNEAQAVHRAQVARNTPRYTGD